jgi:hypothetical protein
MTRFDRWTADAEIGGGSIKLKESSVWHNTRQSAMAGTLTFGYPVTVVLNSPKETRAKR